MFDRAAVQPADAVQAVFRLGHRHVTFECAGPTLIPHHEQGGSQEERVLRALFGEHV
jgi:hypothetical protein